jgi:hypothetical protein
MGKISRVSTEGKDDHAPSIETAPGAESGTKGRLGASSVIGYARERKDGATTGASGREDGATTRASGREDGATTRASGREDESLADLIGGPPNP